MRRFSTICVLSGLAMAAPAARAQEKAPAKPSEPSESGAGNAGETEKLAIWKWANFVVLAGGLGYLAGKNGGPFFASRSRKIRKEMIEAGDLRKEAEIRAAEVDQRLANLESEIAALREESLAEAEAERQRIAGQTALETAKIQAHAEQEIAAAAKAARTELKRYSAKLAVGLAERKIQSRLNPAAQDALVEGFVRDLTPHSSKAQTI